jgi:hypothetical protein
VIPEPPAGTDAPAENAVAPPDLAVVGFSGRATLPWLRLLKPGFRHCFVLLRTRGLWLYYDPMAHYTFATVIGAYPLRAMMRVFRCDGCRLRLVRPGTPAEQALDWRPYTCVEAVKRVLGMQEPWILTPWQLYRRLGRRRRVGV